MTSIRDCAWNAAFSKKPWTPLPAGWTSVCLYDRVLGQLASLGALCGARGQPEGLDEEGPWQAAAEVNGNAVMLVSRVQAVIADARDGDGRRRLARPLEDEGLAVGPRRGG